MTILFTTRYCIVSCATYLGVELTGLNLPWAVHINKTTEKGNRQLFFGKEISPSIVLKSMRQPIRAWYGPLWSSVLQYGTPLMSKSTRTRRLCNDVLPDSHWEGATMKATSQTCWLNYGGSHEHCRWKARLTIYIYVSYNIQFGLVAVPLPEFIVRPKRL